MQIVNFFYELARQHKRLKGFTYNKAYRKGAGNSMYPLLWLDDPIAGQAVGDGVIRWTVNADFLGLPKDADEVPAVQAGAFDAALSLIEQIRKVRATTGVSIEGFNFLSLRDYYDDNAAGYRFTMTLNQANPVNRCLEDFDPAKTFPAMKSLPDFNVDHPDGGAIFSDTKGLPNFKLDV